MTFGKFKELFNTKYPDGEVISHGKMGGTEHNKKTTVVFTPNGKCYEYYGAYEDILNRLGIKVISKSRLNDTELALKHYKEWHGQPKFFEDGFEDYSTDIERLTREIENIHTNYIIV